VLYTLAYSIAAWLQCKPISGMSFTYEVTYQIEYLPIISIMGSMGWRARYT
jgi:hypothetical protein